MKKMPLVSVVIPAYNIESYIEKCLDSILKQTYRNIEIIVVDDGSTDQTKAHVELYIEQNNNIRLIKSNHRGQGIARNKGLNCSRGQYVLFVDGDDYIDRNTIEKLLDSALDNKSDIVICDVFLEEILEFYSVVQKEFKNSDISVSNYIKNGINLCSPCNKLFDRSFINDYKFEEGIFEDTALIPVIVSYAKCISYVPIPLYHYCHRAGTSSTSVLKSNTLQLFKAMDTALEKCNRVYKKHLEYWFANSVLYCMTTTRRIYSKFFRKFVEKWKVEFEKNDFICADEKTRRIVDLSSFPDIDYPEYLKTENDNFLFSIIMAVYNVEAYLSEAIESVIHQDIGFDRVQLILVDDGSTDKSSVICESYAKRYSNNIIYIRKENEGVSSARNVGLKFAKGRFINFLDADDKLTLNALLLVFSYFIEFGEKVDVISIPLYFFDGKNAEHITNHKKFSKGNRIIDLEKEYDCINQSCGSSFLRREALKENPFNRKLIISEDADVVYTVLLEKGKLGVVNGCKYLYRRRSSGEPSAVQSSVRKREYYLDHMQYFVIKKINECLDKKGVVPNYIQYMLLYDIQWRFNNVLTESNVLNSTEKKYYKQLLHTALQKIDDKYIEEQESINAFQKIKLLEIKRKSLLPKLYDPGEIRIYSNEKTLFCFSYLETVIEFIEIKNDMLYLEGYTTMLDVTDPEECEVELLINDKAVSSVHVNRYQNNIWMDEYVSFCLGFRFSIDMKEVDYAKLSLQGKWKGHAYILNNISFGKFSPIGQEMNSSYYYSNKRALFKEGNHLIYRKWGTRGRIESELKFLKELFLTRSAKRFELIGIRLAVLFYKKMHRAPVWLISDRIEKAGDNGEAFFQFINSTHKEINSYFAINKSIGKISTLKSYGKLVDIRSVKYKILVLIAKKIISSSGEDIVTNPFGENFVYMRDLLFRNQYVFLQHGIIRDDLSAWINRYQKNINIFITSAKREYQSILENEAYGYTKKEVKLTGLARYDNLYNSPKKIITIMPTWRKNIFSSYEPETGEWIEKENAEHSPYWIFFSALCKDDDFIDQLNKCGYVMQFMPHPNMINITRRMLEKTKVTLLADNKSYSDVFAETAILITDYSSAVLDFAYLKKPLIYAHFDFEEFYNGQVYKEGYFDYQKDGFGEITYSPDELKKRIIEYINSGQLVMKDKYVKRVDNFFAYFDKKNCERIYKSIIKEEKQ